MDFQQLQTFILLCETENLTHTSELLYKTQPAITKRIQLLEEELGFHLVQRSKGKKSITVTPKGQQFLVTARQLMELYGEIEDTCTALSNSLRISSIASISVPFLTDICSHFMEEYKTKLSLLTYQTPEAYEKVAEKEVDAAFVSSAQNVKNVTCTSIFRQDYFVARVCTSPEPVKQISTSQLNPAKELFQNWNDEYMLWHTSKFGNDNYLLQVDSYYTLKEFLSNPDYWTILPKGNLDELKKMIPLQVYELEDAPPARICYLLTNTYPDKNNLKILRLFKEWALKYAADHELLP